MPGPSWRRRGTLTLLGLAWIAGGLFAGLTGRVAGSWGSWNDPIVGWLVGGFAILVGLGMIWSGWGEADHDVD